MSFGASQGTVRYALMVDDAQAERAITTFRSNLTSLTGPTTGVTRNMTSLNTAFNAGVVPIKAQGNALTTLNANLKTTGTTATGLGTKIKGTATQFAGFATGLSATASGVLQLAAGFRDYSDAQIAVDRQTRKLSLAQEAVSKSTDKLNALTSKGIKSGKEYKQAQLDVSQAQANLSIQTELLGEKQEAMFDAQTQFVASVIPTTLGAIGTLGMAFRELGGTKGMGGLVESFKGFGGSIKTTIIPAIAGLVGTGAGGLSGLMDKIKGVGTNAQGAVPGINAASLSLKGLALTAATVAGPLLAAWTAFDIVPKLVQLRQDAITKGDFAAPLVERLKARVDEIKKLLEPPDLMSPSSWGAALARLGFSDVDLQKARKELGELEAQIKVLESTTGGASITEEQYSKQIDKTGVSAAKLNPVLSSVSKTQNLVVSSMLAGHQPANDYSNMLIDLNKNMFDNKTLAGVQAQALANMPAKYKSAGTAANSAATFTKLFGDANVIAAEKSDVFRERIDFLNTGMTGLEGAFFKGNTDFNTFIDTTKNGIVTADQYRVRLVDWVTNELKLPNAINMTNEQLELQIKAAEGDKTAIEALNQAHQKLIEEFKRKVVDAQTNIKTIFKIDSNADKILKDLIKSLPNKAEKKIKLNLKFAQSVDDAKKAFNDLLLEATQVDDKTADSAAKEIIEMIDKKFKGTKGSFAGLRSSLVTAMKDPNTPAALATLLQNYNWDAIGGPIVKGAQAGINGQTPPVIPVTGKWMGFPGGGLDFGENEAVTIPVTGDNKAALGIMGETKRAWDEVVKQISSKSAVLSANADKALGLMGELKRSWDKVASQIQGKVPKITINADKALDMIGETKRGWDKVASQIEKKVPKIKVNADQALDMIGEVKRGMDKLKDKTVTIRINVTGSAKVDAKGDVGTSSKGDLGGMMSASKGDIGTGGVMFASGSGVSNGPTMVQVNIDGNGIINDYHFSQKVKAQNGRLRTRLGPS